MGEQNGAVQAGRVGSRGTGAAIAGWRSARPGCTVGRDRPVIIDRFTIAERNRAAAVARSNQSPGYRQTVWVEGSEPDFLCQGSETTALPKLTRWADRFIS